MPHSCPTDKKSPSPLVIPAHMFSSFRSLWARSKGYCLLLQRLPPRRGTDHFFGLSHDRGAREVDLFRRRVPGKKKGKRTPGDERSNRRPI